MKRPYISISGTLDELILMEAILAYYYNVSYEQWNNYIVTGGKMVNKPTHIICGSDTGHNSIRYHAHMGWSEKLFKASQLTEILKYIEEHERRNS